MARTLKVSVEDIVPEFIQLAKRGRNNLLLANTVRAVEALSTMYQRMWQRAAAGEAIPGLPFTISGSTYPGTIKRRQVSPTVWEVYSDYTTSTGLGVTALLEAGHGPIDLKPGLLQGPSSRQGKNGRFNIVSFRHGTPGSDPRNNPMPISVYRELTNDVKRIDAQRRAGATNTTGGSSYTSKSAQGGRAATSWGTRYDQKSQRGRRSKIIGSKGKRLGEYTWKSGKYAGMVRLDQSTSRSRHGGYMTFRIVSAMSDPNSWIVPEQEPWPIRKAVTDNMMPIAEAMLRDAMEADIK